MKLTESIWCIRVLSIPCVKNRGWKYCCLSVNVIGDSAPKSPFSWEYRYEPTALAVLEYLVRRYLESVVYQALSDNMASEQAARMVAMKAATDNAGNAIKELRLVYNKSRQAAITTELSEIVAGAAVV